MPVVTHIEGLFELERLYAGELQAGDVLFHAQLHPDIYPSDKPHTEAHRDNPNAAPTRTDAGYYQFAERMYDSGVSVVRLMALYGADDARYDASHSRIMQRRFEELQANDYEQAQVVQYGDLVLRLTQACGEESTFLQALQKGEETGIPSCSFWTLLRPGLDRPLVVGMMHYRASEGPDAFAGMDVCVPEYTPEMLRYVGCSWELFADEQLTTDLQVLKIAVA